MKMPDVFKWSAPLQVFGPIVAFNSVDVIDLIAITDCRTVERLADQPVNEVSTANPGAAIHKVNPQVPLVVGRPRHNEAKLAPVVCGTIMAGHGSIF